MYSAPCSLAALVHLEVSLPVSLVSLPSCSVLFRVLSYRQYDTVFLLFYERIRFELKLDTIGKKLQLLKPLKVALLSTMKPFTFHFSPRPHSFCTSLGI